MAIIEDAGGRFERPWRTPIHWLRLALLGGVAAFWTITAAALHLI